MADKPSFESTEKIFDIQDAFAFSPEHELLFDKAMNEALAWHCEKCPDFCRYLELSGLSYDQCSRIRPEQIPPAFVTIFKEFKLLSIPDSRIKIELTSSGTGGKKSSIVLDDLSYRRILRIVDNIFDSLGLIDRSSKVNYICFTYDPKVAKNVGTAFSDKILTGLTLKKNVFYAIKWCKKENSFKFDAELTLKKLLKYSSEGYPVRILGFPAYLWEICDRLDESCKKLSLGDKSFVITGGGWKLHKDREVTKETFKQRVSGILGIPQANIRDSFGLVEHGIPYVDCEFGRLHVPIYARARTVDPETMKDTNPGEPGLLHLMTPYLSSYPSISILTTDKALIESNCPCKRKGKTIKILARAGLAKHKGCAINALELLK